MTLNKLGTSNVEESREKFEEPLSSLGTPILVDRVWRDSNILPTTAPDIINFSKQTDTNGYSYYKVKTFRDGASIRNLIYYYEKLPLKRIIGTTNCYCSFEYVFDSSGKQYIIDQNTGSTKYTSTKYLADIITDDFDISYIPKIYVDDQLLPYGTGLVNWDIAAGILYFSDKEFAESIKNNTVTICFDKYVGRKGTSIANSLDNADIPFRDSIKHFKNSDNDEQTATFKVRGDIKNTNYILPPENGKRYAKDEDDKDSGVIVLQENLEDTLWSQHVRLSGGEWVEKHGSGYTGVSRYSKPNEYNTETIESNQKESRNEFYDNNK